MYRHCVEKVSVEHLTNIEWEKMLDRFNAKGWEVLSIIPAVFRPKYYDDQIASGVTSVWVALRQPVEGEQ